MKKVVVAGHICLDITPVIQGKRKYERFDELLIPGKLVNTGHADVHTGGAVANTGLALKCLGADVTLLGKVGNDAFGALVKQIIDGYGAGGLIVDESGSTSYSVVLAAPGLDRVFLHNPGTNNSFCCSDVPDNVLDGAELFHFGYPPLMRRMYENEGSELTALFKRIKKRGILTSLDMAAVDPDSEAGKADWRKILENTLPYVDYFAPSLDEVSYMLQRSGQDVKKLANELIDMGAGTVLIKCGTDGMYFKCADDEGMQPCIPAPFVASATGAGDTAIAAFLMGLLNGKSVRDSALLAAAEGACCVTAYDAISGLKSYSELEEMIKCL